MKREPMILARSAMFVALTALCLSACSTLPRNPGTPDLVQLSPVDASAEPGASSAARLPVQVVVQPPLAPLSLDTNRIALLTSAHEIKYLKGLRWSDNSSQIIQTALLESLETTNRFAAVGRPSGGLHADYTLVSEVRDFQADLYSGARPVVRIRLMVQLVKSPAGLAAASRVFSSETATDGSGAMAIVRAFDKGMQSVMGEISAWAQDSLADTMPNPRRPQQTPPSGVSKL